MRSGSGLPPRRDARRSPAPALAAWFGLAVAACGAGADVPAEGAPWAGFDGGESPSRLSEWGFFQGSLANLEPVNGVFPYDVNSPLWADWAHKGRFVALPPGEAAGFSEEGAWDFPPGTVVIKNFFFDLDRSRPETTEPLIVETRLLILTDDGWRAETYQWNEDGTDAEKIVVGARLSIDLIDESGQAGTQIYNLPNTNQCSGCHTVDDTQSLLGLTTAQLNREVTIGGGTQRNQVEWLAERGFFDAPPPGVADLDALPNPEGSGSLDDRARSWLHGNCGHCHQPGGFAGRSGLTLLFSERMPARYGVCKTPTASGGAAGGLPYDITPGEPERSIMVHRMASTDPGVRMPELPNRIPSQFGIDLVSAWIAEMEPGCPQE